MTDIGKLLMIAGGVLFVAGLLFAGAGRFGWLGSLPGDIRIEREDFTLYAPLGTMVVISLILTLVLNIIIRNLR
jgi:hypothetical protein